MYCKKHPAVELTLYWNTDGSHYYVCHTCRKEEANKKALDAAAINRAIKR
jgi:hypothetical protein